LLSSNTIIDTAQPSNIVLDILQQVNLNSMTGNTHPCTAVLNRTKIQAPIFPTDSIKRTNGDDRTETLQPSTTSILQDEKANIAVTPITEITTSNECDSDEYFSDVEIDELSIVSTLNDLQLSPMKSEISILTSSDNLSHINVLDTIHDSQVDDTMLTLLNTEVDDNMDDFDNVITSLQQSTCPDSNTTAPTLNTSKSSRKVRFQDDTIIPTVSILQNPARVKVTKVPLIHSVILCTPPSTSSTPITPTSRINSVKHSPKLMNAEDWRQAFPEPDLASFDNSIYVSVAIQAMSIEDVDTTFPSMSSKLYGDLQSTFQLDGGASLTAISEAKAKELHCQFIERKKFQVVVSVANGQQMTSDYYTPLKVTFKGINQTTKAAKFKTVMIIANIVPTLSGGIIIGSDVMKALQVTVPYNNDNTAMLTVDGETITFQYSNTAGSISPPQPFIRTINVTKSTRKGISMRGSFNALFFGDRENKTFIRPIPEEIQNEVYMEHKKAMSDPNKYMQEFDYKAPVSIPQLVALHCILTQYDVEGIQHLSSKSTNGSVRVIPLTLVESTEKTLDLKTYDTIYDKHIDKYVNSVHCLINRKNDNQCDPISDYISHRVDTLHTDQFINKLTVVNGEVVDDVAATPVCVDTQKEQADLLETNKYLAEMRKIHCNIPMLDQRPDEFPLELWNNVFDSQKVLVKERWATFKSKCNPPERLQDVIKQIMKIDISKENLSRAAEEPYFRAQCLANLHIYAHPDPTNPPSVKGREYEINLNDTSPCTNPMRRTSLLEKAYLYWRTKQLMGQKMIGVSSSAYNNPPLCVPYPAAITAFIQKHGDQASEAIWKEENAKDIVRLYRLVNDFRDLNNKTKLERWPLPYILDLIDKMKGSGRYSTEDIEDAFFTVPMKKEHRQFTGFSTPHGHFEYLCMGQGLKNAANFFARIVHEMFYSLQIEGKSMSVYQDDVCNFSDDLIAHLILQQEIYDIMEDNTLVFKSIKGHLNYSTQRILGHIMSKDGRAPDPTLISTITSLARPKTLEAIRSCLGLAQVAREYIHNLADIIAPIQQMARKGVDIEKDWGPEQEASFAKLKEVITTAPVLKLPNLMKKFRIHVDACRVGRGIGAILLQIDETIAISQSKEVWQPIAYWSRALIGELWPEKLRKNLQYGK